MNLVPLTSSSDISKARKTLLKNLGRGCKAYVRNLGWQGGSGKYYLHWNSKLDFWVCSHQSRGKDRWIILLGTTDPREAQNLGIVCEVNPAKNGIDRRCAGLFVRDNTGAIYLTHSGKVGGGRKGVGKLAFRSFYRGAWDVVDWPDGEESEVIVIGRIDAPRFSAQVSRFIREVEKFKVSTRQQTALAVRSPISPEPKFNREFAGKRASYSVRNRIAAECDHGLIVNSLADALAAAGFNAPNDRKRDLYVVGENGKVEVLFEVKTDTSTSTIYQSIGQLLYHSAEQTPAPCLVLVAPELPDGRTKTVLDLLNVNVLVYDWRNHEPYFGSPGEMLSHINEFRGGYAKAAKGG